MTRPGEQPDRVSEGPFPRPDIPALFRDGRRIDRAIQRAVREAVRDHKLRGQPVATWREGRVVWIPPEEIPD